MTEPVQKSKKIYSINTNTVRDKGTVREYTYNEKMCSSLRTYPVIEAVLFIIDAALAMVIT